MKGKDFNEKLEWLVADFQDNKKPIIKVNVLDQVSAYPTKILIEHLGTEQEATEVFSYIYTFDYDDIVR